ncbi:MAG: diguanylate cyclase [Actinomycetota bacterium]
MGKLTKRLLKCLVWVVAAVFVGSYAAILRAPLSPSVKDFAQDAFYIAVPFMLVLVAWLAFGFAKSDDRRSWLFVALGGTTLLLGETGWLFYQNSAGLVRSGQPAIPDTVNLCAFVLLFGALLAMSRLSRLFIASKLRFTIDAMVFFLFGALAMWVAAVRPALIASPGAFTLYNHVNEILPIVAVGSVITLLANLISYRTESWSSWERLVALGLVLFSGAIFGFNYLVNAGLFGTAFWPTVAVELGWMTGVLMFTLAALHYLIDRPATTMFASETHVLMERPKGREILTYIVLIGCLPFLIFMVQTNNQVAFDIQVFIIGAIAWAGLLLSRVVLIMTENSKLFSTSIIDPVTGAYNLRFFQERLEVELERAKRSSESLSLAVIDIDNFREFNNTYGHALGDKILVSVVAGMRLNSRKGDTVYRVGGDEFTIIMPNTGVLEGHRLCTRIKDQIVGSIGDARLSPKLSCGISSYPYHARESKLLYKYADDAMYWAKFHGKDQVTIFDFEKVRSFDGEERLRKAEEFARRNTAQTLAEAMDARDEATKGHAKNVAALAEVFASRLNLSKHKIDMIKVAALVHDIGKISMPELATKNPDDMTEDEATKLREHTTLCEEILFTTDLSAILPWVVAHHERWDGGGYPAGLEGNQIPYEARILALCDAYENLTRSKRDGASMSHTEIMSELIRDRGRRFDPMLTDSFVNLLELLNSMRMTEAPRRKTAPVDMPAGRIGEEETARPGQASPIEEYADLYALVRQKLR